MNFLIKSIVLLNLFACAHNAKHVDLQSDRMRYSAGIKLWPNAQIPFVIDEKLQSKAKIYKAMKAWSDSGAIEFVERTVEENFVIFTASDENECVSQVGTIGGRQELRLGDNCGYSNILHEMGHLIGLQHEHNRPDADEHLKLNLQAINPDRLSNFKSWNAETSYADIRVDLSSDGYGDYDFHSIMHYRKNAFSRCNESTEKKYYWSAPPEGLNCQTIEARDNTTSEFGMRPNLTTLDKRKVKYLYKTQKSS